MAVQEYRADIEHAQNAQQKQEALDGLAGAMMARTQKAWLQSHPEADLNEAARNMKKALLSYGQGNATVQEALENAGFSAPQPGSHTMRVMSYIGQQAALIEKENAEKETQKQYSIQETYDYSKSFAEQVEDYKNGMIPERDTLLLGRTPELLNKIGISDLPLTINQQHIAYMLNGKENTENDDHIFSEETIKKLPELIANPVAVIESRTRGNDSVVVVISVKSENGKNSIAAIEINGIGKLNGNDIDSNAITSVYGRKNTLDLLTDAINTDNKIYYINKTEAHALYIRAGVQFPGAAVQDGLIHSIFDAGVSVNREYKEQTDSRQFKKWFGKSVVVNQDGTPKAVYHGTNKNFSVFESQNGAYWASESEEYAEEMAHERGGGHVMQLYMQIRKPYYAKLQPGQFSDPNYEAPLIRKAKEGGYDGLIIENDTDSEYAKETFYVVFDSSQIKSATDNVGTFDKNNKDIRYSISETQQMPNVMEDAELYAQSQSDKDMKAALMLVKRLHETATKGAGYLTREGEPALQKGDWQKRISEKCF